MENRTFADSLNEIPNRTNGVDFDLMREFVKIKCKCLNMALEGGTEVYHNTLGCDDFDIEELISKLVDEGLHINRVSHVDGIISGLRISWSNSSRKSNEVKRLVEFVLKYIEIANNGGKKSLDCCLGWRPNSDVTDAVVTKLREMGYNAVTREDLDPNGYLGIITVKW